MTARSNPYADSISERELQGAIVAAAKLQGWNVYHPWDSRKSEPGWPDLTFLRPPELFFAELKSAKGKVTAAQQRWIDELTAAGCEVHCWRPKDLDEALARLRRRS